MPAVATHHEAGAVAYSDRRPPALMLDHLGQQFDLPIRVLIGVAGVGHQGFGGDKFVLGAIKLNFAHLLHLTMPHTDSPT